MVEIRKLAILEVISVLLIVLLAASVLADELMIQDFGLDSPGEDDRVKPGDVLNIQFDVVNTGSDDLEDITLEMWFEKGSSKLKDNNGDRIEPEFNLRDIDAGDDKSVDYDLLIPWEVDDGDRYDIMVRMKGKVKDGSRFTIDDNPGNFRIERENHELYVNASFEPESADCGDDIRLYVHVRNIGTNEEDDVNITAVNKLIGADFHELIYLDDNPDEDDSFFEKTYSFSVSDNANPGLYELSVRADYDEGYKEAYKTIMLTVNNCVVSQSSQQTTTTSPNTTPSQPTTTQPSQTTTQPAVNYVPATPSGSSASSSVRKSSNSWILPVVLGEIALIVIIVVLYLILRKPKQPKLSEF